MFSVLHNPNFKQLIKFLFVGLINTILCLILIYFFMRHLCWNKVPANMIGYFICILLGFIINSIWTFEQYKLTKVGLMRYFLVAGIAYILNLAGVVFSSLILDFSEEMSQLVGVPVFTVASYFMNKYFVFNNKPYHEI